MYMYSSSNCINEGPWMMYLSRAKLWVPMALPWSAVVFASFTQPAREVSFGSKVVTRLASYVS